jgi:tetratricopeptide (TPR) repeat protein
MMSTQQRYVANNYKYKAFISYSHSDEKWASWLHKALEAYRPPKGLVGQETPYGPVPARFAPVFRDREELATSTSLGDTLTEALRASACQIVICSPRAAKSRWTNEEILAFKRLGKAHRIFALIVDGEPGASENPETADEECFPPALIYELGEDNELTDVRTEPIAADARPGKDPKQAAKLKLLAGMLGVGFDDLRQREVQRRQRRMMVLTAAAVVGMTITSGLAITAYVARLEAEEQRRIAEIEAETARQTTEFMVGLFEVSDPSEALGNTITAREILDKGAARIDEELADQPEIQATLMDTMGTVYTSLGLYDAAAPLVLQALERRQDLFGQDHADVARSKNHLGEVLALRADYAEAEREQREALQMQQRLYGESHPEIAATMADLSDVLFRQGKYVEAEPIIRKALEMRRAIFGDAHAEIAESLEDLGRNYEALGDYEQASSYLYTALDMRRAVHPGVHPDTAIALTNLANLLYEMANYEKAEALDREALEMKRVLLGDVHPEIVAGLNNLAFSLHDRGDYEGAEAMYREALAMSKRLLGDSHPDVAAVQTNLAYLFYDKGDTEEAIHVMRGSLDIYRNELGNEHPDVANTATMLGYWLIQQRDFWEAERLLDEALVIQRELFGDAHPDFAGTLTAKAELLLETGRFEESRETASEARQILQANLPEGHWRTAMAASAEGAALVKLALYQDAEALLLSSHKVLTDSATGLPLAAEQSQFRVAELYRAWGKPGEANKYLAENRVTN